jgi:glutathione synthase
MSLRVAIQMDPPETLNIKKDTTFLLGLEAQKRGYELSYYHPSSLGLESGKVTAFCHSLEFRREPGNHYSIDKGAATPLADFDLVLMRQDFTDPLSYNAVTHILDHARDDVLILNDPTGVRESPEKLLITHFPDLAPPTLITRELSQIKDFWKKHGDIILKPLNGFGGLDIYHLKSGDDNLNGVYDMMTRLHTEPLVVQKYLPEIKQGDKRIILVEGEPVGCFTRIPAKDSAKANLHAGGTPAKSEITAHDKKVCKILKPELVKRGLVFVGLDMIGDYVTEINPKSPTGLKQIEELSGVKCEEAIWDAYETRLQNARGKAL